MDATPTNETLDGAAQVATPERLQQCSSDDPLVVIPGYREAILLERRVRTLSFLDIPSSICGVDVMQLTPRHMLMLEAIESPIILSQPVTPTDVAIFLWVVSPEFSHDKKAKERFIRKVAHVDYDLAMDEIREYFRQAFMDNPSGSSPNPTPSSSSWVATLVDTLAHEYHWPENVIVDIPMARLWQYLRAIIMRNNPDAVLFSESVRVRGEWMRKVNG